MGVTQVQATIFGNDDAREYTFMVDTGSTYLALPMEEIEALGLEGGEWGTVTLMSATGPVEVDTYFAKGGATGPAIRSYPCAGRHAVAGLRTIEKPAF